jgi:D-serine dehydratase
VRQIYLASSWRNPYQPNMVDLLREHGHQVYDFRNPSEGWDNGTGVTKGFAWSDLDPEWKDWDNESYRALLLGHPVAALGFESDWQAMQWANTGVLLLPSGRSAHIEAGYFTGAGKELHIVLTDPQEPELMYRMATAIHLGGRELVAALA